MVAALGIASVGCPHVCDTPPPPPSPGPPICTTCISPVPTIETDAEAALSDAELVWQVIAPFVSCQLSNDFNNAIITAQHAISLLSAASMAATAPDLTTLIQDVEAAIAQVIAIIDQYGGNIPMPDAGATPAIARATSRRADMTAKYADLQRQAAAYRPTAPTSKP
jgi:hypothetical protein